MAGPVRICLIVVLIGCVALAAQQRTELQRLQDAKQLLESKGDYAGAIDVLQPLTTSRDRSISAQALLALGEACERLGRDGARQAYEALLKYDDQPELKAEARTRLALLTAARQAQAATPTVNCLWGSQYSVIGALSPDERAIPATDRPAASLGLLYPATGRYQPVLHEPRLKADADLTGAAISPDGKRLAFAWSITPAPRKEIGEIHLVGVDGAHRRTLISEQTVAFKPIGWTPDGRTLVATRSAADGTNDLLSVESESGAVKVLAHLSGSPRGISLSRDGRFLAYDVATRPRGFEHDIAVLNVSTGLQRTVVDHPADDSYPVWHPDGHRLFFVSDRTETPGVWVLPAADSAAPGEPSFVRGDMGPVEPRALALDGSLYFTRWATGVVDVFVSQFDRGTGRWSTPVAAARHVVGNNYFSAWSPDSRWLALTSRRRGHMVFDRLTHTLVLHDMTTRDEQEFSPDLPAGMSWPAWSPDGRSVTLVTNFQGSLYRIDVGTGVATALLERDSSLGGVGRFAWMPDGRSIVFAPLGIVTIANLDTHIERKVYEPPEGIFVLQVVPSPDGRLLAVAHGGMAPRWPLVIVPVDGGPTRTVTTVPALQPLWIAGWTPDGATLIVSRENQDGRRGRTAMWSVPAAGGDLTPLGIAKEGLREPRLSPDGLRISFTAGYPVSETCVLENAIPPTPAPKR
jgi:Tol biopolymer transport system component